MSLTKLQNLVNPEVMADIVSAKLPQAIKFTAIAKVDNTLVGRPGDTITVPKFAYIGPAEDVAEGVAMGITQLTASTTQAKVKKAGKATEITDEAVLSGYGDPLGESTKQLTLSIADKVDNDCLEALYGASMILRPDDTYHGYINYRDIVDAVDLFTDENDQGTAMVMFVHPDQVTQLRKDYEFLDMNRYPVPVIMTGAIGSIAGCQIIKSKRVKKFNYTLDPSGNITVIADDIVEDDSNKHLSTVQPLTFNKLTVGDRIKEYKYFVNPIVVVDVRDPNQASEADGFDESTPALTIYMKRGVELETDRDTLAKTTVISADEHYTTVLSNDSKVVLVKFSEYY